jgi:prepilin-type N-terminal cleavage/methylation domain-containing protein
MKFFFIKTKNKINSSSGFTLLEVLVAITIFIFALVATMTAARSGLASAYESRDQVISFYLAQEAVEFIRNKRDTNSILNTTTPTNWLEGISALSSDPCAPGYVCLVDVVANTITRCGVTCPDTNKLRQDTSTKMYGHNSSWPLSQFKREVRVQNINSNEASITVLITWPKGSFEVKEIILNWQT